MARLLLLVFSLAFVFALLAFGTAQPPPPFQGRGSFREGQFGAPPPFGGNSADVSVSASDSSECSGEGGNGVQGGGQYGNGNGYGSGNGYGNGYGNGGFGGGGAEGGQGMDIDVDVEQSSEN
ncbi:hypothetical protein niasHT_029490 [Heterodera trifolii]|uniref:Glycine-rich protein n=1 Tax=Heterodera trifolii TaxID=157864 RepID=A0ABD2KCA9_9BILA